MKEEKLFDVMFSISPFIRWIKDYLLLLLFFGFYEKLQLKSNCSELRGSTVGYLKTKWFGDRLSGWSLAVMCLLVFCSELREVTVHNSEQCFTGSSLGTSSSDLNLLYKFGCIGREEVENGKMHGSSLEITTWWLLCNAISLLFLFSFLFIFYFQTHI